MTLIWLVVILAAILYFAYLIYFNKKWRLIKTTFSDEEYFYNVELLRGAKVKYLTKMVINWGYRPGYRTYVDHKQVDFYVRKQDSDLVHKVLNTGYEVLVNENKKE